ncbi:MAG: hypothetical protein ACRDP3_17745 [Streptomyces sp.]|uniref:hypothetical protein n=1 Tax=Streptomyces sp. TaxID=1931 RepID=UPI003D6A9393
MYDHDLGWETGPDTDDAHSCVADLRTALSAHGITLPSIGVDPPAFAASPSLALVALGNCNIATARKLAAVLRTAWRGETPS